MIYKVVFLKVFSMHCVTLVTRPSRHTWRSWIIGYCKQYTTKTKGWGYKDFLQRTYRIYQRGFWSWETCTPNTSFVCASEQRFEVQFTETVPLAARGPKTTFWDESLWTLAEHSTGQIYLGECETGLHFHHPMCPSRTISSSLSLFY